jgi:hypothetical protein
MLIPGLALIISVVILANASEADLWGGGIALVIGGVLYQMAKLSGKRS